MLSRSASLAFAIALIERGAMALGVNSNSPYQSLADLIADGQKNPEKLDYASTGAGGASHLLTEQFKATSGFDAVHVPYRGGAPASNDLLAGNIGRNPRLQMQVHHMNHIAGRGLNARV